jgi:hypothetical protein
LRRRLAEIGAGRLVGHNAEREFPFASFPALAELLGEQRVLEAYFQSRWAQIGHSPALELGEAESRWLSKSFSSVNFQ